jgi:hypothetical protein
MVGYTILAMKTGDQSPLYKLARWYERLESNHEGAVTSML